MTNLKFQGGSENYTFNHPCFYFFWNSPFPRVSHQERSGISRDDQEKIMWNFQGYWFLCQKQPKKSRFFTRLPWLDFFWNSLLLLSWAHQYARHIAKAPTDQSTTYSKVKAASYEYKKASQKFCYKWINHKKLLPVRTDIRNMI